MRSSTWKLLHRDPPKSCADFFENHGGGMSALMHSWGSPSSRIQESGKMHGVAEGDNTGAW